MSTTVVLCVSILRPDLSAGATFGLIAGSDRIVPRVFEAGRLKRHAGRARYPASLFHVVFRYEPLFRPGRYG